MSKFWSSSSNKEKLQAFLYKYILQAESAKVSSIQYVVSHMINSCGQFPCVLSTGGNKEEIRELQLTIEEADARLVPHVLHSINCGTDYILVISNDTDVIVYMLYYWEIFCSAGLKELWVKAGIGHTKRFIPIHVIYAGRE